MLRKARTNSPVINSEASATEGWQVEPEEFACGQHAGHGTSSMSNLELSNIKYEILETDT